MLKKCGELFVLGFNGYVVPSWLREFAHRHGLGGVILFDYDCASKKYERNVHDLAQLRELCKEIAALPTRPLVFIDQEGGKVRRLKEERGFCPLPSAEDFARLSAEDKVACVHRSFREMRECGIGFNLAPVIDINRNPLNPDIGALGRSYGDDVQVIEENVAVLNQVAKEVNIGLCVKHFPGIGGSVVNSHDEVMELSAEIDREQIDLFYRLAPQVHGEAILLSHALLVQNEPVSVSKEWVNTIRRECAKRAEVLLITDDLQMQGMQMLLSTRQAVQQALRAGVDLFLLGNNLVNEDAATFSFAEEVEQTLANDAALAEKTRESFRRIRERKLRFS